MILVKVPLTGTLQKDGTGDPKDPVRIAIDLGDVSWEGRNYDFENGIAVIEITDIPRRYAAKAQLDAPNSEIIPGETDDEYAIRVSNTIKRLSEFNSKTLEALQALSPYPKLKLLITEKPINDDMVE